MRMLLNVTYNGDVKRELEITAADIVRTEDKYNVSVENLERYSHVCFLAWSSESRQKNTAKDFDEWLLDVVSVEAVNDPKEPNTSL